jgi:hypothetical protein
MHSINSIAILFAFLLSQVSGVDVINSTSNDAVALTARDFVCTDFTDFFGDDIYNKCLSFDDCLFQCRQDNQCNAMTWVQAPNTNTIGTCYFKHLTDIYRKPVKTADNYMVSCQEKTNTTPTPTPPLKYDWVRLNGFKLWGEKIGNRFDGVDTEAKCLGKCQDTAGCNAFNYAKHWQTCELVKDPTTFQYDFFYGGAPNPEAVAVIRESYSFCRGNADIFGKYDVHHFDGTFRECDKCFLSGKAVNAFVWTAGQTVGPAIPVANYGHCYCKKIPTPVNVTEITTNNAILCIQ